MAGLSSVVSVDWLANQGDNPQLVIIDCRFRLDRPAWGYEQYQISHIPGAYHFDLDQDLSSPIQQHGGRHPLPDLQVLSEKLSRCGIKKGESLVVIYDDARFAFASRLWWLLRYLGHGKVVLLDGGWSAWQGAHYPVSDQIPSARSGDFYPSVQKDWIVDIEQVKVFVADNRGVLVDSRDCDRYLGEREPIDPIAGHIAGAVNSPWQAVTDEQGYLLPLDRQHKIWEKYQDSPEIVAYCGSGVTACVNLLSLALVGRTEAKLYAGGWSDWCSYLKELS